MNPRRLFIASCLALIATSMAFSIRADIIPGLKADFGFSETEMGQIAGPGLWGFTITILLSGLFVDLVGMGRLMGMAFAGHIAGVFLTIFAQGYYSLFAGTLLIGLANGLVEGVINPLAATVYSHNKTKYLNILHAWWPGGLILGGLAGYGLTKAMGLDSPNVTPELISLGWKVKMCLILIPTLIYGFMFLGAKFPETERVQSGISFREMAAEAVRPLFVLFLVLMVFTTSVELGPDQWIGNLLQNLVGIQGVLLLVYTAGIMFVLRQFAAGMVLRKFGPPVLLTGASVLSAIGLYLLSYSTTAGAVFLAATVFGFGKAFFWPTMVGFVSEQFPKGGALLMGLMGGVGMLSVGSVAVPTIGMIQDHYQVAGLSAETKALVLTEDGKGINERKVMEIQNPQVLSEIDRAKQNSAAMSFRWISMVPALLTLIFGIIAFWFYSRGGYQSVRIVTTPGPASTGPRPALKGAS